MGDRVWVFAQGCILAVPTQGQGSPCEHLSTLPIRTSPLAAVPPIPDTPGLQATPPQGSTWVGSEETSPCICELLPSGSTTRSPSTLASQASYRVTGDTDGAFSSLVTLGSSFTLGGKATEEETEEDGRPGGHRPRAGSSCRPLRWPRFFLSPVLQRGMCLAIRGLVFSRGHDEGPIPLPRPGGSSLSPPPWHGLGEGAGYTPLCEM